MKMVNSILAIVISSLFVSIYLLGGNAFSQDKNDNEFRNTNYQVEYSHRDVDQPAGPAGPRIWTLQKTTGVLKGCYIGNKESNHNQFICHEIAVFGNNVTSRHEMHVSTVKYKGERVYVVDAISGKLSSCIYNHEDDKLDCVRDVEVK